MSAIRDSSELSLPELIFGIAGPIGVNIETICESLSNALSAVRYSSQVIHLTKEMMAYKPSKPPKTPDETNYYTDVLFKIKYADALCEELTDASALARIAIRSIGIRRKG